MKYPNESLVDVAGHATNMTNVVCFFWNKIIYIFFNLGSNVIRFDKFGLCMLIYPT